MNGRVWTARNWWVGHRHHFEKWTPTRDQTTVRLSVCLSIYLSIYLFGCYCTCLSMATELFEDIFEVRQLNPDGKKFDKGVCVCVCVYCSFVAVVDAIPLLVIFAAVLLTPKSSSRTHWLCCPVSLQ